MSECNFVPKTRRKLSQVKLHRQVCEDCGVSFLKETLRLLFEVDNPLLVQWKKWETLKIVNPKTQKEISKCQEVEKSGSPAELVDELL